MQTVAVGIRVEGIRAGIGGVDECPSVGLDSVLQAVAVGIRVEGIRAGVGGVDEDPGIGLNIILQTVAIAICAEGIGTDRNLLIVLQTIAIGVCVEGVAAVDENFFGIAQAVVVGIILTQEARGGVGRGHEGCVVAGDPCQAQ